MSHYDLLYKEQVKSILISGISNHGEKVRTVWADGSPAYTTSIFPYQLRLDGREVPILTTKRVAWKSAIHELLWFYVHRTSDVTYLKQNKVKIWDEWTRDDNTIGRAYGYQLGKRIKTGVWRRNKISGHFIAETTNQVHRLIHGLINDPSSRRHVISLWNIDDLWDMSLPPCVWNSQWIVSEGKLHVIVGIRSNDVALGQPFNVFQYYVLLRMLAQVTGYEVGTLTFNVGDCHIYDRHIDQIEEQVNLQGFDAPQLILNPDIKNFDDFTIDDFQLLNYNYHPSLKFEVAI